MAIYSKLLGPSPQSSLALQKPLYPLIRRSLTTTRLARPSQYRALGLPIKKCLPRRTITVSSRRAITGQEAPSAQAYISSGVIGGKQKLVDVKKVLVIGSGGLSIGQAGEFDYSG